MKYYVLQPLLMAIALLSQIPVARLLPTHCDEQQHGYAIIYYPLVGLLIGVLLLLVNILLPETIPVLLRAALLIAVWTALTGALHLDGLADTVDAWFAGHRDPEKILTVLKDPTCGPMAITVLVFAILLKVCLVTSLLAFSDYFIYGLLFTLILARSSVIVFMLMTPVSQQTGMAATVVKYLPGKVSGFIVLLICLSVFILLPFMLSLILISGIALLVLCWRQLCMMYTQGFTGDYAGALIELTEMFVLLVLVFYITSL